ncbi:hypothetical protein NCAS_0A09520 [Naumovozyma castellii]|uniref:Phosphatidylinositol 4-kinase n=1 Tax=Naumovozyma castellii TaxID=27288 RepID=G0V7R2_NAUCA|nr:hypothetical protein NCAS_0A09520 [Naumovozyma castellii CBS 4309]CCC67510.1 hypothetical protein NCAS_0A09520 [Naumovozyma castellii CBS 4309]
MTSPQIDRSVVAERPVTSNTYDWLQYRESIDQNQQGRRTSYGTFYRTLSSHSLPLSIFTEDANTIKTEVYDIQLSVFRPVTGYPSRPLKNPKSEEAEFLAIVQHCRNSINRNVKELVRIKTGSSGSYFVYGTENQAKPMGVFKPKDEEPYGPLSPKWSKWAHRTFFPCLFGRSCLIPNLGYICESAASLLDKRLETHLVPYTDTVQLESKMFYDKRRVWLKLWRMEARKQEKIGSFQLFLNDYVGADEFLKKYPLPGMKREHHHPFHTRQCRTESTASHPETMSDATSETQLIIEDSKIHFPLGLPTLKNKLIKNKNLNPRGDLQFEWTEGNLEKFRLELEKLIILDYIMRNTDRGLDNWMIKIEPVIEPGNTDNTTRKAEWSIKLGAIDNGLAFPWKHPDEWRLYPYGWLYLPLNILARPFSESTRRHFIPLLTDKTWWEDSYIEFTSLFQRDADFKDRMWKKQWAVLKGQAFNVLETLRDIRQGPLELVRRTRCIVMDEKIQVPEMSPIITIRNTNAQPPLRTTSSNEENLPPNQETGYTELLDSESLASENAELPNNVQRLSVHPIRNKIVIAERLQAVVSDPVFTWC